MLSRRELRSFVIGSMQDIFGHSVKGLVSQSVEVSPSIKIAFGICRTWISERQLKH